MFRLGVLARKEGSLAVVEHGDALYDLGVLIGEGPLQRLDALYESWDATIDAIDRGLSARRPEPVAAEASTFDAPVASPAKVICIGINYRDHIEEMGVDAPEFPYAFLRPPGSLTGHGRTVALPQGPTMIDWEAELGVVIGRRARHLDADTALAAVAGYTVVNDVSARDWIETAPFVGVDWVMQKAWDDFQPTGPWLVPARFVPDPQALSLELTVNGVTKQKQTTAAMVFGVADILVHLSKIMTLEPGDIIATGTPAGVGFGRRPREFLRSGDEVAVTISGLGTLKNRFV